MTSQGNMKTALQQQNSSKSGWLRKQGGIIKSWHNRWFTLKGDQLYYYTSELETKPQGSIFLPGNRVIEHPLSTTEPDKFLFEIIPGENKSRMTTTHETYPLCAANEAERKGWILAIRKVMYAEKGGAIFGQSLAETMNYEKRTVNRKVPLIAEMCVEYLLNNALDVEGIFRLPGRTSLVRTLREQFDCGEPQEFIMPDIDVHSVASLFKLYLRELPSPLIPLQFYEPVMKIVQRDLPINPGASLERLAKLLENIPRHSYNLLQYLCKFLNEIAKYESVNKMSQMNLATVFVNCIIRPEDDDPALLMGTSNGRTNVTYVLINQPEKVFRVEYTHQGGAVQVDTLLDLEGSTNSSQFKADTSMPQLRKSSLASDLLGLELGAEDSTTELLSPVASVPSVQPVPNLQLDLEKTEEDQDTGDPIYAVPMEANLKVRSDSQGSVDSGSGSPEQSTSSDIHYPSVVVSESSPKVPTRQAPPVPGKKADTSASPVLPTRPAPPPPVPNSESVDSLATDDSGLPNDDEDVAIEALVNTDLSQASADELRSHVETLCIVLKQQRANLKDTNSKLNCMIEKQNVLEKKLKEETTAKNDAINKILNLQLELQAFYMTLGEHKKFGKT